MKIKRIIFNQKVKLNILIKKFIFMINSISEGYPKTEQRIIEAATKVFLQKGMYGARMQEIASTAGINKALLHYYFRSKEKLYQHIFLTEISRFLEALFDAMQPIDDVYLLLKTFIYKYIDQIQRHPQVVRFILWEIQHGGESFNKAFKQMMDDNPGKSIQTIIQKIKTAVQKKQILQVDPEHLIFNLIGMCIYTFVAQPIIESIFPNLNVMNPNFLKKRKDEILHLIWNGLKP